MSPAQRHALVAAVVLVPALAYELREVTQGADGWPYSRFLRLLPPPVFLGCLVGFNAWIGPHILRRTAKALAAVVEQFDDSRPEIEEIG